MLTLTLDGQEVDLPADAQVALSFRSSDLRRLDTREAAFSETFALPLTAQNARVLGTPHALSSQTRSPYRKLPAVLRAGGVPVLQGVGVLEASELGYELTLLDDTADLFGKVGDASLRELDLSTYDHTRTLADVQAASTDNSARGYVYALSDTGRLAAASSDDHVVFYEQPAAVYELAVLRAIVARALPGFTLAGSLLSDALFLRSVLPAVYSVPRLREAYLAPYRVQVGTTADVVYAIPAGGSTREGLDLAFPVVATGSSAHFADTIHYGPPNHAAQVEVKGRLRVKNDGFKKYLALHVSSDTNPLGHLWRQEIPGRVPTDRGTAFAVSFAVSIPALLLAAGETLSIRATDFDNGSAVPGSDPYIRLTLLAGSSVTWAVAPPALRGAPVHLETALPDFSQADYLKLLANRFNATFSVQASARTVRIDLFNELERRRNEAPDWSAKLDYGQRPRLDYRIGDYAQTNTVRYADAPDAYAPDFGSLSPEAAAEQVGTGTVLVPDETLPLTAEAYTAPVILPEERDVCGGSVRVAWLPSAIQADPLDPRYAVAWTFGGPYRTGDRVTYAGRTWTCTREGFGVPGKYPNDPVDNTDWSADAIPDTDVPAVAVLVPLTAGPLLYDDQLGASAPPSYPATWGLSRAGASFAELLPAYHEGTARILARVQLLTAYFTLGPADINALDFSVPVRVAVPWIVGYGQLNGLFYVNLIDQYQPGVPGPTRVELLRLGAPVAGLAPAATPLPQYPERALLEERTGRPLRQENTNALLEEPL